MLFHFISYRASDAVFTKLILQFPNLLQRSCWQTDVLANDPRIRAYGRAHKIGLLPDTLRHEAAENLESAALTEFDVSFFADLETLALILPLRLVGLGLALRTVVLPSLKERIDGLVTE